MTLTLRDAAWPQITRGGTVVVPVGSIEQHGPHLPMDTDTVIAAAVADRVVATMDASDPRGGPWVLAPAITYGASGEHQSFPGTTSIGSEALAHLVIELVRSLMTWAERVVFVNAHGGNIAALTTAVNQLRAEGHDVLWLPCESEDTRDSHAGFIETSLMLHLRPDRVRMGMAEAGCTLPLREIMADLVSGGVGAVSSNGVLGDPTAATAQAGRVLFEAMVESLLTRLSRSTTISTGDAACVVEADGGSRM